MNAVAELKARLRGADTVRRIGQALWMMIGEPIDGPRLLWARVHFGPDAEHLMLRALEESGAIGKLDRSLQPEGTARFLVGLWAHEGAQQTPAQLLWTLPPALAVDGVQSDGFVSTIRSLIGGARKSLTLISPYIELKGIGLLQESLREALGRGVDVRIIGHELHQPTSSAAMSLEELRREARGLPGRLTIVGAQSDVLVHLKAVVADHQHALIGSANLTYSGLVNNLEVGVRLDSEAAFEIERIVEAMMSAKTATLVYSIGT